MSHLSTILNRIKRKKEQFRHNPTGLITDPLFLRLIRNTQEYQAMWTDYTGEEADAANTFWERYKQYLKPEDQKNAEQLRAEFSNERIAELMQIQQRRAEQYPNTTPMHITQVGQVVCGTEATRFLTIGTSHRHHKCALPYGHSGHHKCTECGSEWSDNDNRNVLWG